MSEPRLIKKYPNRRLYDTQTSAYVTLDKIVELVQGGTNLLVIDRKTEKDITTSILLQVITKMAQEGKLPILPTETLLELIRVRDKLIQMRNALKRGEEPRIVSSSGLTQQAAVEG